MTGRRRDPRRGREESFDRWCRWLTVVSAGVAVFGVAMAVLGGTPLFGLVNAFFDPVFWPGAAPAVVVDFRTWVYGAWGATLAGWGIVLLFIARGPFAGRERWAWRAVAVGTVTWFVLDTAVSVLHGVLPNVVLNVVVMGLVAAPLWGTRRDFR